MNFFKKPDSIIRKPKLRLHKDRFCSITRNIIYKALENRMSIAKALQLANTSRSTFERWIRLGENPENLEYHHFRNKIEEIRAKNEAECLEILQLVGRGGYDVTETRVVISEEKGRTTTYIKKTMLPNWSAAAWYLERCCSGYELKPYQEQNEKSPDEVALEIMQAIREIEGSVGGEDE